MTPIAWAGLAVVTGSLSAWLIRAFAHTLRDHQTEPRMVSYALALLVPWPIVSGPAIVRWVRGYVPGDETPYYPVALSLAVAAAIYWLRDAWRRWSKSN